MVKYFLLCLFFSLPSANSLTFKKPLPQQVLEGLPDEDYISPDDCREVSSSRLLQRRQVPSFLGWNALATASIIGTALPAPAEASTSTRDDLTAVTDPNTYSAILYSNQSNKDKKVPLLVVLHGAGKNEDGVWSLADPKGEHAGLAPSLVASGQAPPELTENFAVVAPYAAGKRSFYEEPRSKLLKFVDWVCSEEGQNAGCPSNIDPNRIFLFGFSDGATVGVELATTRRFKACVICAYGYSGILPSLALERLKDVPFWVFHSKDDVIFPVSYGDQLVKSLRSVSKPSQIRYTKYDRDQEGFTGDVRGHSVGITASKLPDLYAWMLSIS